MESLSKSNILLFPDNTLEVVRNMFNIKNREEMDRAIDILDFWIKQQMHFSKKDFSRSYLERLVIRSKGSVERAKGRLDKMCTARTHLPYFFGVHCVADREVESIEEAFLPRLTKDYCRVHLARNWRKTFMSPADFQKYYQRLVYFLDYFSAHDYNAGLILIADYREMDLMTHVKSIDIVLMQKAATLLFTSYGLSVKSIHIISSSKLISVLVSLLKQVLSDKIGSRINVHESIDELPIYVDKAILPEDYGGEELPLADLHKNCLKELSSKDFMDHVKDMDEAKVREELRLAASPSAEISSLHGTFRRLTVD